MRSLLYLWFLSFALRFVSTHNVGTFCFCNNELVRGFFCLSRFVYSLLRAVSFALLFIFSKVFFIHLENWLAALRRDRNLGKMHYVGYRTEKIGIDVAIRERRENNGLLALNIDRHPSRRIFSNYLQSSNCNWKWPWKTAENAGFATNWRKWTVDIFHRQKVIFHRVVNYSQIPSSNRPI